MSETRLRVYGDHNTVPSQITDTTNASDRAALMRLIPDARLTWVWSGIGLLEANAAPEALAAALNREYGLRVRVEKDERLVHFNFQDSGSRGFIGFFSMANVQNDELCKELMDNCIHERDAQHITQAVCNNCDVFATCDVRLTRPKRRAWLKFRFPSLRVLRPFELEAELSRLDG